MPSRSAACPPGRATRAADPAMQFGACLSVAILSFSLLFGNATAQQPDNNNGSSLDVNSSAFDGWLCHFPAGYNCSFKSPPQGHCERALPGECVHINGENVSLVVNATGDFTQFHDDSECKTEATGIAAVKPSTDCTATTENEYRLAPFLEPPFGPTTKQYFVCSHVGHGCSERRYCALMSANRCSNLQLPIGSRRTMMSATVAALDGTGKVQLNLWVSTQRGECHLPFLGNAWDGVQLVLDLDDPRACGDITVPSLILTSLGWPDMSFSVHPASCTDCRDFPNDKDALPPEDAFAFCSAILSQSECNARPDCLFFAGGGLGCISVATFLYGYSDRGVCVLSNGNLEGCQASNNLCTYNRSNGLCTAKEPVFEVPRLGTEVSLSFFSLRGLEMNDGGVLRDTSHKNAFNAIFTQTHPCDYFIDAGDRKGLYFTGHQHIATPDASCSSYLADGRGQLGILLRPSEPHVITNKSDLQAGFSGQRYVFPPTLRPSESPNDLSVGVSVGTNGVSVLGFNGASKVARPLLVWEGTLDYWVVVIVTWDEQVLSIYLHSEEDFRPVGRLVAETTLDPDVRLYYCPGAGYGYSVHGAFVGAVSEIFVQIPSPQSKTGEQRRVVLNNPCRVASGSADVTVGGQFAVPAVLFGEQRLEIRRWSIGAAPDFASALVMDSTTGIVFGVPHTPGNFNVSVSATTEQDRVCVSGNITFRVAPALQASLSATADTGTTQGAAFDSGVPLHVSGGIKPYVFTSSPLPLGLSVDSKTGSVSGVAEESGTFNVRLTAADRGHANVTVVFTLTVQPPMALSLNLLRATLGAPFKWTFPAATGGNLPFRFSLSSVPSAVSSMFDVSMDPVLGVITGTPRVGRVARADEAKTGPIVSSISVQVADAELATVLRTLPLEMFPTLVAVGSQETPFSVPVRKLLSASVVLTGGYFVDESKILFSVFVEQNGAPSKGLSVSVTQTQPRKLDVSGVASTPGSYAVSVRAHDSNGAVASVEFDVDVTEAENASSSGETVWTIIAVPIVVVLCLLALVSYFVYRHYRKKKETREFKQFYGNRQDHIELMQNVPANVAILPSAGIQLIEQIGRGGFGSVYKGYYHPPDATRFLVAVKKLHKPGPDNRHMLYEEAKFMAKIRHTRIVGLIGFVMKPAMLVMEYADNGTVKEFLVSHSGTISLASKMLIAGDVLSAMKFLEESHIVHRDLAARNVLIDASNRCLVSDFGRARLSDSDYMSTCEFPPIRWMPTEVLEHNRYSSASDVYSFGILLFEVFSEGKLPWEGLTDAQVCQVVNAGEVMAKPAFMPSVMYRVACRCCKKLREDRPTFANLERECAKIACQVQDPVRIIRPPSRTEPRDTGAGRTSSVERSPLQARNRSGDSRQATPQGPAK